MWTEGGREARLVATQVWRKPEIGSDRVYGCLARTGTRTHKTRDPLGSGSLLSLGRQGLPIVVSPDERVAGQGWLGRGG